MTSVSLFPDIHVRSYLCVEKVVRTPSFGLNSSIVLRLFQTLLP